MQLPSVFIRQWLNQSPVTASAAFVSCHTKKRGYIKERDLFKFAATQQTKRRFLVVVNIIYIELNFRNQWKPHILTAFVVWCGAPGFAYANYFIRTLLFGSATDFHGTLHIWWWSACAKAAAAGVSWYRAEGPLGWALVFNLLSKMFTSHHQQPASLGGLLAKLYTEWERHFEGDKKLKVSITDRLTSCTELCIFDVNVRSHKQHLVALVWCWRRRRRQGIVKSYGFW